MNKPIWLARLLTFGVVLETLAGLGLLIDPAGGVLVLLGASMQGSGVVIGRIAGGALLSLGIACWLARKTPTALASVGVACAYLVYNVVTCVTLAWTNVALEGGSLPALCASLLHGVLGAAMLGALLQDGHDL